MPALAKSIEVGEEDRAELERVVRSSTAEVRMGRARPDRVAGWRGLLGGEDRPAGGVLDEHGAEVAHAL